jgi:hypothetical protein
MLGLEHLVHHAEVGARAAMVKTRSGNPRKRRVSA